MRREGHVERFTSQSHTESMAKERAYPTQRTSQSHTANEPISHSKGAYLTDRVQTTTTKQPVEQALATLKEGEEQRPSKIVATSKEAISSEQDIADAFNKAGVLKGKVDVSSFWSNAFDDEIKKFSKFNEIHKRK